MGALPESTLPGHEQLKERIDRAFQLLQESRGVEFKGAANWPEIKGGLPKDVLAMANTRDGGVIIIGVEETDNRWHTCGLSDEQVESYDPDCLIAHVNKYASPPMEFDVVKHIGPDDRNFVVIHVREFSEVPIVCKRNSNGVKEGALYVRPLGKAESREVHNAEEMHDLLSMAIDKSSRAFLERLRRIGVPLGSESTQAFTNVFSSQLFDDELEGL